MIEFVPLFFSSVLGSGHCVGMCGGLVLLSSQGRKCGRSHVSYQTGRLCMYLSIGIVSGGIGQGINHLGQWVQLSFASQIFFGTMLFLSVLLTLCGNTTELPLFPYMGELYRKLFPQNRLPFTIGLLSGLLPCGLLFSYAALAASSASPLLGMAILGTHWAGTTPALSVWSMVAKRLDAASYKAVPVLRALLLLSAGLLTLFFHTVPTGGHSCH